MLHIDKSSCDINCCVLIRGTASHSYIHQITSRSFGNVPLSIIDRQLRVTQYKKKQRYSSKKSEPFWRKTRRPPPYILRCWPPPSERGCTRSSEGVYRIRRHREMALPSLRRYPPMTSATSSLPRETWSSANKDNGWCHRVFHYLTDRLVDFMCQRSFLGFFRSCTIRGKHVAWRVH